MSEENGLGRKLSSVCLVAYDFDGVMTDNRVIVDQDGHESAVVNRGDGWGVARIRELGIEQVIISTEVNPIVAKRAEKLGLEVIHGVSDKQTVLSSFCADNGFELQRTLFIGNDLNDRGAMLIAGVAGCPSDAEPEIIEVSDWVSNKAGGFGVVRDLYRTISLLRDK